MIILTSLAIYQTRFWIEVAKLLSINGEEIVVFSFDDRSTELLEKENIRCFDVPGFASQYNFTSSEHAEIFNKYNIANSNFWISHERITFAIYDSKRLNDKFCSYLLAIDEILNNLKEEDDNINIVQEVGGFLSVIATFFSAKYNGLNNYFIEPSFFKGRMFFKKNSFSSPQIESFKYKKIDDRLSEYVYNAKLKGTIVIPNKDKHHYSPAFKKVFNLHNLGRFFQKSIDKYILRKYQEFGFSTLYAYNHLKMISNSLRLQNSYTNIDDIKSYVYFPFHVPGDVAITLRSPEYLDQLSLVEYLARIIPGTHNIVVKEHPAMIGAIDVIRLKNLLKKYDNLFILDPSVNNYKVINSCDALVSINSKSGAEAIMLGKPVAVLGDAFYNTSPLVNKVNKLNELPGLLDKILTSKNSIAGEDILQYFQCVWDATSEGELYENNKENLHVFSNSLIKQLKNSTD